jgi:hypothetical protein
MRHLARKGIEVRESSLDGETTPAVDADGDGTADADEEDGDGDAGAG